MASFSTSLAPFEDPEPEPESKREPGHTDDAYKPSSFDDQDTHDGQSTDNSIDISNQQQSTDSQSLPHTRTSNPQDPTDTMVFGSSILPGIILVMSRITRPDLISPTAYTTWYEGIHIPDILNITPIESAYRYIANQPAQVDFPFSAIYPIQNEGFSLLTNPNSTWWHVPITSDTLPIASHSIFDLAQFSFVSYRSLLSVGKAPSKDTGAYPYVTYTTIPVPARGKPDHSALISAASAAFKSPRPVRSTLFRWEFKAASNDGASAPVNPPYLVIHEFAAQPKGTPTPYSISRKLGDLSVMF
ncbi:hypothetical protein B0T17DRAFT_510877 [Bombardia bombarda]|uniref:Uncharacterized protein n=1 Tax=Bombardia bombarda TaxID=252184 RepID=A0AA40BVF2_9PEZI|nr:hypothetical protein B0T17DRAFT_510877 [Bombardia bombarda]